VASLWVAACVRVEQGPRREWVSNAMDAQTRGDCVAAWAVLDGVEEQDREEGWFRLSAWAMSACSEKFMDQGYATRGLEIVRKGRREFPRSPWLALYEGYLGEAAGGPIAAQPAYADAQRLADEVIRDSEDRREIEEAKAVLGALRVRGVAGQ